MIEFLTNDRVIDVVAVNVDGELVSGPVLRDVAFTWLRQGRPASGFENAYADWTNGYVRSRRVTDDADVTSQLRPVRTPALVAAGDFDEVEHPRDSKGKFAKKAGTGLKSGKKLKITHGLVHKKHEPGTIIAVNGSGGKRVVWDGSKYLLQEKDSDGGWPTTDTAIKSKAYTRINEFDSEWHEPGNDGGAETNVSIAEPQSTSEVSDKKPASSAGAPLKITHGLVHKKHEPGTVIAQNGADDKRVVWDGAEYRLQRKTDDGKWTTEKKVKKSKAYVAVNEFDSDWREPSTEADSANAEPSVAPSTPSPAKTEAKTETETETTTAKSTNTSASKPSGKSKVTKEFIEQDHPADTVIAESDNGYMRVYWNGDEYELQVKGDDPNDPDDWDLADVATSDDVYAAMKQYSPDWYVPGTQADDVPELSVDTPESTVGYKKIGAQKGSQTGALTQAPDGQKYYVKAVKSESHARNEVLANKLYAAAGVNAPQVDLAQLDGGPLAGQTGVGVKSKIIDGDSNFATKINDPAYKKKVYEDFAVDAWLGNWDVVGLNNDNIITDKDGNPARIDNGGALLYRAQGTSKGMAFGDKVTELKTLRDPKVNPQAAKAFKDVTDDDIRAGVTKIEAITPEQIDALVDEAGFNPKSADNLKKTLKARRQDLLDQYGSKAPKTATPASSPTPTLGPTSSAPDNESDLTEVSVPVQYMDDLSNGVPYQKGKLFTDSNGVSQYVKLTHSSYHAKNEFLAANLYKFAGANVENTQPVELDPAKMDGKVDAGQGLKITPVENTMSIIEAMKTNPSVKQQVNESFAIDAWLGNWNTAGLGYENLTVDKDGKVRRTNLNGALAYRANGVAKGAAFGDTVNEIDTLRNPSLNPTSSKVFADVTDEDIRKGVAKIEAMSPKMIDFIISHSGLTGPSAKSMSDTLKARRQDLINKYGSKAPAPSATSATVPAPSTQPTATNALNTGGPKTYTAMQKSKVYAIFNKHNLKWFNKTDQIYDAAHEVSTTHSDLTMADALDIMDQSLKKKTGNPFRTKVEKWLKTKAGKNHALVKGGSAKLGGTSPATPPASTTPTTNPTPPGTSPAKYTDHGGALPKQLSRVTAGILQQRMNEATPPPWNSTQKSALTKYTGGYYQELNRCARGIGPCTPANKKTLDNINAAMKPSTDDVVLYRKTDPKAFGLTTGDELKSMIGKTIKDDGVISTSIKTSTWSGKLHLEIEAPKGSMMAWVQPISNHPGEDEMVVAPGTHYEIIEVIPPTDTFGPYRVKLRIIPGSDARSRQERESAALKKQIEDLKKAKEEKAQQEKQDKESELGKQEISNLLNSYSQGYTVEKVFTEGNSTSKTELLLLADGTRVVRKSGGVQVLSKKPDTRFEYLSGRVYNALGGTGVHTAQVNDNTVITTYVEGEMGGKGLNATFKSGNTNAQNKKARKIELERQVTLSGGKEIGLLDYLISNLDRHSLNWIVKDDKVYPIDQGGATFIPIKSHSKGKDIYVDSDFTNHWLGVKAPAGFIDSMKPKFTKAELAQHRANLESIKGEFAEGEETEWFNSMMSRLAEVESKVKK